MDTGYASRNPPTESPWSITYEVEDETVFTATLAGRRVPLTSKSLLGATVRYPLITFKIMAAIHWEAAKLWVKGARYRKRPAAPVDEVSVATKMAA